MKFTDRYPNEVLRALSWKQPFASLMLHGKVETRVWDSKYRGLVLICASKQPYSYKQVINISGDKVELINKTLQVHHESLPKGMAIAIGRLHTSISMALAEPKENVENNTFVKYNAELFMHFYTDVQPIVPFDWKGSQGWRTVDEETKSKIILL